MKWCVIGRRMNPWHDVTVAWCNTAAWLDWSLAAPVRMSHMFYYALCLILHPSV